MGEHGRGAEGAPDGGRRAARGLRADAAQRAVRGAEVDGGDPVAAGDRPADGADHVEEGADGHGARPAVPAADADAAAEARGHEPAQAVGAHDDGSLGADAAYAGGGGEADEHAVAVRVPADGHGLPDVRPGSGDEVNGAAPTYVKDIG